jgi:hypothetical protein
VTLNDEGDGDTGPNEFQNFPEVKGVASGSGAAVKATLSSRPSSTYELDFFSNQSCHESGYGEGTSFLGSASLTTDGTGKSAATASFSSLSGSFLTGTATDGEGNTSELSLCTAVTTLAVSSSPSTRTVQPGGPATYPITVSAQGGEFEEVVALGCAGNPAGTTCSFDQDRITLAAGQASTIMTVTTVAPAGMGPSGPAEHPPVPPVGILAVVILVGMLAAGLGYRSTCGPGSLRTLPRLGAGAALATLPLIPVACGDDATDPPSGGTSPGSYDLTVTASWESAQVSTTVTLVVQ